MPIPQNHKTFRYTLPKEEAKLLRVMDKIEDQEQARASKLLRKHGKA